MAFAPAVSADVSVLVMDRSALVAMVTVAAALSFVPLVSVVVPLTLAVFVIVPVALGATV